MRKPTFVVVLFVLFALSAPAADLLPKGRSGGQAPGLTPVETSEKKPSWLKKLLTSPVKVAKAFHRSYEVTPTTILAPQPKRAPKFIKQAYAQYEPAPAQPEVPKVQGIHEYLEEGRQFKNFVFGPTNVEGVDEGFLLAALYDGAVKAEFSSPPHGTSLFVETRVPNPPKDVVINGSYSDSGVSEVISADAFQDREVPEREAVIRFTAYPPGLESRQGEIQTQLGTCNHHLLFKNIVLLLADPAGAMRMLKAAKATYAAEAMKNIANPVNLLGSLYTDSCKQATPQDLRSARHGQIFVLHAAMVEMPEVAKAFLSEERRLYGVRMAGLTLAQPDIPIAVEVSMGESAYSNGQPPPGVAVVIEAALVEPKKGRSAEDIRTIYLNPPPDNTVEWVLGGVLFAGAIGAMILRLPPSYTVSYRNYIFLSFLFRPPH